MEWLQSNIKHLRKANAAAVLEVQDAITFCCLVNQVQVKLLLLTRSSTFYLVSTIMIHFALRWSMKEEWRQAHVEVRQVVLPSITFQALGSNKLALSHISYPIASTSLTRQDCLTLGAYNKIFYPIPSFKKL